MDWYFSTFKISKCSSSKSSFSKQDLVDKNTFSSSGSLNRSFLLRFLKKHVHLTFGELSIVSLVFDRMIKWNGRIYCKVLYALAGGKEEWLKLKKKLYCFLSGYA